jgi:selenocysteine-specific elongation factor
MARVALLDQGELEPGGTCWAQLRLEAPLVARGGDRFVIRSYSPVTTIGGGIIVEPLPGKRKRLAKQEITLFRSLISGSADNGLLALAGYAGGRGLPLTRIPIESPFTPGQVASALERLKGTELIAASDIIFPAAAAVSARGRFLDAIDAFHESHPLRRGIDIEQLRRALPKTMATELGEFVLERLEAEGDIVARGSIVARAGFEPRMNEEQRGLRESFLRLLESAELTPPNLAGLPPALRDHPDLRQLLQILEEEGTVVALAPDLYLSRTTRDRVIEEIRSRFAGRGPLTAAEFREAVPVSRKYLIPLLEHLDSIGVTRRSGDTRTIP